MGYCYEYPRPSVSADIAVFRKRGNELQVLLIKRGNEPFKGMWALPGGFMEMDETLEETAARELEEETGLAGIRLEQFHTFSQVDRDPRTRIVTTVYYGFTNKENDRAKGGDDADEACWFSTDHLPQMGFDHEMIIRQILNDQKITPPDFTLIKPAQDLK